MTLQNRLPFERRKERRDFGFRVMAYGAAFVTLTGALSLLQSEYWVRASLAILGIVIVILGMIAVILGIFVPRDPRIWASLKCRAIELADLDAVYDFIKGAFGNSVAPKAEMEKWHKANDQMFFVVEEIQHPSSGQFDEIVKKQIVGFFDVIPLKSGALKRLDANDLDGVSLTAEHISKKRGKARAIYIGGVVGVNRAARSYALGKLEEQVNSLCKKHSVELVYARPVTPDGLRLLKWNDFKTVTDQKDPEMMVVCRRVWRQDGRRPRKSWLERIAGLILKK